MRISLVVILLAVSGVPASPVPRMGASLSEAERKQLQAEALTFAQQLLSVSSQVSTSYVRPVSRLDLLKAALVGVFQAARQPVPPGLLADLKKLSSDEALIDLLVQARIQLGICPELQERGALLAACRALLRSLDPHSDVVTEQDRKSQPWGDQPAGLGLELAPSIGLGPLRIQRVLPGTPAQRAGLRPGDEITHLDGRPVKGMTTAQASGLLEPRGAQLSRGGLSIDLEPGAAPPPPPPVTLRVNRPRSEPWKVSLEFQESRPESIFGVQRKDDNSWHFFLDRARGIAHVRLEVLNRGTASELAEALSRMENVGLKGLILDLRWSSGGFLDEAIGVAGLFLGDCVIATIRSREREAVKYHNTQPKRFEKLPLVVLVNGQTSGGSELIVAALQDHKRAAVAGQRTLGKASVQTALYVDIPGASLKLTSGEFLRPSGKNLHRRPDSSPRDDWGIRPDAGLEYPLTPELGRELRQNWERQTLRPGSSREALPLDDPASDPQRRLAQRYLEEKLGRVSESRR